MHLGFNQEAVLLPNHSLHEKRQGGTQRTTTLSALLQVKANHPAATLGAFQLLQGIKEGLWWVWDGQRLQMELQTLTVQGNYSRIPASMYSTDIPKKKHNNQHLNQARTLCSVTSLLSVIPTVHRLYLSCVYVIINNIWHNVGHGGHITPKKSQSQKPYTTFDTITRKINQIQWEMHRHKMQDVDQDSFFFNRISFILSLNCTGNGE